MRGCVAAGLLRKLLQTCRLAGVYSTVCEGQGAVLVRTRTSPKWTSFAIRNTGLRGTRGEFIQEQCRCAGRNPQRQSSVVLSVRPPMQAMLKEGRSADARPVRRPFQSRPGPLQDGGAGRHMGQGS